MGVKKTLGGIRIADLAPWAFARDDTQLVAKSDVFRPSSAFPKGSVRASFAKSNLPGAHPLTFTEINHGQQREAKAKTAGAHCRYGDGT